MLLVDQIVLIAGCNQVSQVEWKTEEATEIYWKIRIIRVSHMLNSGLLIFFRIVGNTEFMPFYPKGILELSHYLIEV